MDRDFSRPRSRQTPVRWYGRTFLLRCLPVALGVMLVAAVQTVAAQAATDHSADGHGGRVEEDAALTLQQVIEHAFERAPQRGALRGRDSEAAAWRDRARAWLGGTPALSLRYQTDRLSSDDGFREYEAGLELPLWRLGERRATKTLAGRFDALLQADRSALHWMVAGQVRTLLWDLAEARFELEVVTEEMALAGELHATIERQHELGELATTDLLLARAMQLDVHSREIEAHARLFDREREYLVFAQLRSSPPLSLEPRGQHTELSPHHPWLAQADAQVARAVAERERIQRSSGGSPTLLLGPKREELQSDDFRNDSLGITFRLPLAAGAVQRLDVATAESAVAAAQALRDQRIRDLELLLHEAEHGLSVVAERTAPVAELARLAERQLQMSRRAFEAGELALPELIRMQQAAVVARSGPQRLRIEEGRHRALYNQALGEVP